MVALIIPFLIWLGVITTPVDGAREQFDEVSEQVDAKVESGVVVDIDGM